MATPDSARAAGRAKTPVPIVQDARVRIPECTDPAPPNTASDAADPIRLKARDAGDRVRAEVLSEKVVDDDDDDDEGRASNRSRWWSTELIRATGAEPDISQKKF